MSLFFPSSWKLATLLKRDSKTGVFLWILQNFKEHIFWRTFANSCSFFILKISFRDFLFFQQKLWMKMVVWFISKYTTENCAFLESILLKIVRTANFSYLFLLATASYFKFADQRNLWFIEWSFLCMYSIFLVKLIFLFSSRVGDGFEIYCWWKAIDISFRRWVWFFFYLYNIIFLYPLKNKWLKKKKKKKMLNKIKWNWNVWQFSRILGGNIWKNLG